MFDPKMAYDHPAMVVQESDLSTTPAGILRVYEVENDVTFAALDNDALAAVRAAYAADDDEALHAAVGDLLGLEDGRPVMARIDHPLTTRELGIARLVAQGKSDREIATSLFISPRTVQAHLMNIYAKIDANNRTQLSGYMHRKHLIEED